MKYINPAFVSYEWVIFSTVTRGKGEPNNEENPNWLTEIILYMVGTGKRNHYMMCLRVTPIF